MEAGWETMLHVEAAILRTPHHVRSNVMINEWVSRTN